MDLFSTDDFAQCWVKDHINFRNPPFPSFNPGATRPEDQLLRLSQQYGIAWMNQRVEAGGGIVADSVGLGKVISSICHGLI
jgi:SNF2 family DNA or RNA helicase